MDLWELSFLRCLTLNHFFWLLCPKTVPSPTHVKLDAAIVSRLVRQKKSSAGSFELILLIFCSVLEISKPQKQLKKEPQRPRSRTRKETFRNRENGRGQTFKGAKKKERWFHDAHENFIQTRKSRKLRTKLRPRRDEFCRGDRRMGADFSACFWVLSPSGSKEYSVKKKRRSSQTLAWALC